MCDIEAFIFFICKDLDTLDLYTIDLLLNLSLLLVVCVSPNIQQNLVFFSQFTLISTYELFLTVRM